MKRDWDVIREVLIEVEALTHEERLRAEYGILEGQTEADRAKAEHVMMLWEGGYLDGADAGDLAGPHLMAPELTWAGRDLLDTLRSPPVWERIKTTAKEKGLELTFDVVKGLGKLALDYVLKQGGSGHIRPVPIALAGVLVPRQRAQVRRHMQTADELRAQRHDVVNVMRYARLAR